MINQLKKLIPANMHPELDSYHQMSEGSASSHSKASSDLKLQAKIHFIKLLGNCCASPSREASESQLTDHYAKDPLPTPQKKTTNTGHCATLPAMGSPMHTRAILASNSDSPRSFTADYSGATNMDLICSIADTYDLPSDSDTYSYISNCLMQKSYDSTVESRSRRLRRSHASLCDTKYSSNNETGFSTHRQHRKKYRSRSQSASRKSRYKCGSNVTGSVMTDSNCSTVIL